MGRQGRLWDVIVGEKEGAGHATVLVSVSGGRTSCFMAAWMKDNENVVCSYLGVSSVDYVFAFANTGMEMDGTLSFMNEVDIRFGLGVVWIEAVTPPERGVGTTFRIVDFESAARRSQFKDPCHPFHQHIRKHGVPNQAYPNCSKELKAIPIDRYMRSLGHRSSMDYWTAIGIREDETRRVSAKARVNRKVFYPLVDIVPSDRDDVIDFWNDQDFDLSIHPDSGNCLTCFKKSHSVLARVHRDIPGAFDFAEWMETKYSRVGPEFRRDSSAISRAFFRHRVPASSLVRIFEDGPDLARKKEEDIDPCSGSCEFIEMEFPDQAAKGGE